MTGRSTALGLVALLIVAPIGAAVILTVLLVFGVQPQLVFLPGHALKSWLEAHGHHVHNRVAVLTTAFVWWLIIVAVWLALRRLWRRSH